MDAISLENDEMNNAAFTVACFCVTFIAVVEIIVVVLF